MIPFLKKLNKIFIHISDKEKIFEIIQKTNYFLLKKQGEPFSVLFLLPPKIPADHPDQIKQIAQISRKNQCNYFISWNLRDMFLWRTPKKGNKVTREYCVKTYFTIQQIPQVENPVLNPSIETLLEQKLNEALVDLKTLDSIGHLYSVAIDSTFFVHRLHQAINVMAPLLKKSISTQIYLKPHFKKEIEAWAVRQGIANYDKEGFLEAISRQIVYRLLGRIIFYESLRRYLRYLPEPDFSSLDPSMIIKKLNHCFEKAREIDYQAVFEEEIIDSVPYPQDALVELQNLLDDLQRYNFANMPQDVIGNVFERLIPEEERHALGQYFTREDLVDFINAFCIQQKDDMILDPTCGTGTFLIRAYDRLKYLGEHNHQNLLQKIWGIDIAHFPAQLATINLFRQKIEDSNNFPRVISLDFFQVNKETVFRFPPPKTNDRSNYVEETLPRFNAIVGNFPYIRQELIEKRIKGYKKLLEKTLASEWLLVYPNAFELKDKEKKELELAQEKGVDISDVYDKVKLRLSGQADIYAYLFFHSGYFLNEGGRMGIVTSNAWLDVAYGYELQKFFLNNFKIIAIVESRCEPWFEDASVNTIFTILERCTDEKQRNNHLVKFVKIKKRLKELIPWDIKNPLQRWKGIDKLVQTIERAGSEFYELKDSEYVCSLKGHKTYETENFRIRVRRQGELTEEVKRSGKTVKWGKYIRAPEVYFEILDKCADKLVPLNEVANVHRGYTTGINEFFYLDEQKIRQWKIEPEFLKPVIKSPKESDSILIDPSKLKFKIFMCNKSKEDLKKEGKLGALKYIEWGEKQKTKEGVPWPEVPSVKSRKYWWWLGDVSAKICWTKSYDDRFLQRYYPHGMLLDQRVYGINSKNNCNSELLAAIINSSLISLFIEILGRVNLGDGVLDTTVEESKSYLLIPDIEKLSSFSKQKIISKFKLINSREIFSIFLEKNKKDRKEFDSAILKSIGLYPEKYLPKIYAGLCELVRERLEIPKMRKKVKNKSVKRNIESVKEEVIKELLSAGVKKFPDDFIDQQIKQKPLKEINIPAGELKYHQPFFGETTITGANEFVYKTKNPAEIKYIKYAHNSGAKSIKIPEQPLYILKVVSAYERYIKELKNKLFELLYNRIHDQKLSHQIVQSILEEYKIPEIQK